MHWKQMLANSHLLLYLHLHQNHGSLQKSCVHHLGQNSALHPKMSATHALAGGGCVDGEEKVGIVEIKVGIFVGGIVGCCMGVEICCDGIVEWEN